MHWAGQCSRWAALSAGAPESLRPQVPANQGWVRNKPCCFMHLDLEVYDLKMLWLILDEARHVNDLQGRDSVL